jgi:hypothetical protein
MQKIVKANVEVLVETKCLISIPLPEGILPPSFEAGQFVSEWLDKYLYPLVVPVGMAKNVEQSIQSWEYANEN